MIIHYFSLYLFIGTNISRTGRVILINECLDMTLKEKQHLYLNYCE